MSVRRLVWLAFTIASAGALRNEPTRAQTPQVVSEVKAFVDRYCVTCHDDRQRTAGVVLGALDPTRVAPDATVWESVVRRLRDGTMPPAGTPRPDAAFVRRVTTSLERSLDQVSDRAASPGPPNVRRLNRFEYRNVIRDLLAIDVPTDELLPSDESIGGWDNGAAALTVSPLLMERYLSAARRITRLAIGDPGIDASFGTTTYTTPQDEWQDSRTDDDLPFGTRGVVLHHWFPLDGEYRVRVRLRRTILGYIRGLGNREELEIRLDGARVAAFAIGGEAKGAAAPESFAGAIAGSPEWETYALTADEGLQTRLRVRAGPRTMAVDFVDAPVELDGVQQTLSRGLAFNYDESRSSPSGPPGPSLDTVLVDGPYAANVPAETPSRARIMTCHPDNGQSDESCARTILSTLATRAYRRPAAEADVQVLLPFFRDGAARRGFDEGIRAAVERLLVDPGFLFRIEQEPGETAGNPQRVSDVDLASRLSFFLWSSIPDDELIEVARAGRLHESTVLDAEVQRMLADSRASALVDSFATQWLSLRHLQEISPDPARFPEFDGSLRRAFEQETKLFVDSQIQGDRSVLDLVNADYTFVNERLARFYGMPNVHGSRFRKVTVTDPARRGLLGHGSILTLTSYPDRTSPIVRGRWLLDTFFGTLIPPPPADVPPFPAPTANGRTLSVRERTERHRTNPACASCHARMDPLGFTLENFDPIGRWRSAESGRTIDASAVWLDGTRLSGPEGLRALLVSTHETLPRAVAAKLLSYAMGRPLGSEDTPAVRRIVDAAAPRYNWRSMIAGVIHSAPFQARSSS